MASNFATSDRWFQPVMSRTHPNREYLYAATSQGDVYPMGTDSGDNQPLTAKTIFQELQSASIRWKIYVNPKYRPCTGPPYSPSCLLTLSYIRYFAWGQSIPQSYPQNIAPSAQYFTDLKNGTSPQVAFIERPTAGRHLHQNDWPDMRFGVHRLSRSADRGVSFDEEALRFAYSRRSYRDPEADRKLIQPGASVGARCAPDEHDGVL